MALLKCKMCGGDLEITEDVNIAECEYCGTKQTVPVADNEKKLGLFNRANRLRMASEFDKAASVYENIISDFPEEAEAYWGLCLCNYGIEYVDDPATGKKIPTCHRSSFESILDSNDFEMVMENADAVSRKQYRDEAKAIEELRKAILEVSSKEEPYDIFICYKETDEKGDRTIDSVIAQDVYNELTDKGYRVFFSRITLEDKLGQEYEPYIFAALNSAKIMLAFGTDYEYYNAVWVKNEWSRFLQLIARGEKKTLIPCYKNIDAYDMPKEFARLQAQDMGKVGAVQDLLRGIEKIIGKKTEETTVRTEVVTVNQSGGPNSDALLKRGFLALEDGDFSGAKTHFNKVLDMNAECADAYLGLAMAEERVCNLNVNVFNLENKNFLRAKQFAGEELLGKLATLEKNVLEEQRRIEEERARKEREAEEQRRRIEEERIRKLAAAEEAKRQHIQKLAAIRERNKKVSRFVGVGEDCFTVMLKTDGTVVAIGKNNYKQCNVSGWRDIVAVDAGYLHTVGLKKDGTVVVVGSNAHGQCNTSGWRDIVAIAAYSDRTIGLKADGTVVATGLETNKWCDVSGWNNIVAVAAGGWHTVGLKSDGTVVAVGANDDGRCNVSGWKNIVAIAAGDRHTVGLKADGTIVTTEEDTYGIYKCWSNIVAIAAGGFGTVGLKADGTVVGKSEASDWKNIVAIFEGDYHTVGLKADGTLVADGSLKGDGNCNVSGIKLFDDFNNIEIEQKEKIQRRSQNLCLYCGGTFKGLFTKKCTSCGKEKDY